MQGRHALTFTRLISYPTSSAFFTRHPLIPFPSFCSLQLIAASEMSQLLTIRSRCLVSTPQEISDVACSYKAQLRPSINPGQQKLQLNSRKTTMISRKQKSFDRQYKNSAVRCSIGLEDFIGGDLVKFDLGQWLSDVEEHKALAIYSPHEGGYEGRYLNRLRYQGYHFLDLSARGLGDPETTLTKFHPVCPPHLGKQPIARWYFPPEVDYRLSLLPPNAKGLVVWVIEAKVLSKAELQFLALLPTLRPRVKVIAECGNWRKFMWKPLKEIAGLSATDEA